MQIVSQEAEGCYYYSKGFIENQKGAITIDIDNPLYSNSALLVLIGTSLNIDSTLLALNWQYHAIQMYFIIKESLTCLM